jgi:hypothetical protein
MTPTPKDWNDADFEPAPVSSVSSVDELVSVIRNRLAVGETPIDDLRLLILTRLYQGHTQLEIEFELAGWGLKDEYVAELVCSTRASGNFGGKVVSTELVIGQVSVAVWKYPTFERKKQLAARARQLDRQARRLVGKAPCEEDNVPVELGFVPEDLSSSRSMNARWAARRRVLIAALVTLGLVFGVIALIAGR